jgi:glycosyltransferase involved in cell wall biosynthesis
MLKILHIIPSLRKGGAERLVLDICNELYARDGVEVCLVCFSDENHYADMPIGDYIKVIPASVKLSVLKKNKYQIRGLQDFIDDFEPDVIHSHLFEAEIVSRSCIYHKAKWFSHCHDNMRQFAKFSLDTLFDKQKFTEFYEKMYLDTHYKINGGNNFIAISKDSQRYIRKMTSAYPVHLLHNAIDYKRFNLNNQRRSSTSQLSLINVGSLSENKNQIFLLKVASILKDKGIGFSLVFAGDGKDRENLDTLVNQLNVNDNIIFLGSINNVETYLSQADIYLHSAKSEAFGLTLLEAMASGLPVITLDGKGNRDLIEQGKNGYMIYEQNPELFAQTIIDLWEDRQKYYEISTYAQEYARQYDIKQYVDNLLALYQAAIEEKV